MATYGEVDKTLFGGLLPGGATQTQNGDNKVVETPLEKSKRECREGGGQWINGACVFPQPKNTETTKTTTTEELKPNNTDQVFKDPQTGRNTGVTIGGKTYLGLNPQDVDTITQGEAAKAGSPTTQAFAQQAQAQQTARQAQQALQGLGLTPDQIMQIEAQAGEAPIDWGQAITAGIANVLPSLAGGAAGGAVIGAVGGAGVASAATAPLGAVIGAAGGAVTGFLNGLRSNIKSQQSGEIQTTTKSLNNVKSNLRQIRMLAQADPSRADEAVELFNQQMAIAYAAQAKLKKETSGNLNAFMDDGTEKLAEFDLFFMGGGYAELQRQRLQEALAGGMPMSPEQILLELQSEAEL